MDVADVFSLEHRIIKSLVPVWLWNKPISSTNLCVHHGNEVVRGEKHGSDRAHK